VQQRAELAGLLAPKVSLVLCAQTVDVHQRAAQPAMLPSAVCTLAFGSMLLCQAAWGCIHQQQLGW
jgi:hypothetical protein